MQTVIIIISIIATILLFGVAFFLFAIWRAIIGKSTIDLRVATSVDVNTKKLTTLGKELTTFEQSIGNLKNDVKDLGRNISTLTKAIKEE